MGNTAEMSKRDFYNTEDFSSLHLDMCYKLSFYDGVAEW